MSKIFMVPHFKDLFPKSWVFPDLEWINALCLDILWKHDTYQDKGKFSTNKKKLMSGRLNID